MCWAAADRMARIAQTPRAGAARRSSPAAAERSAREILDACLVDPERGSFVADYGGDDLDASLLQAVTLRLLPGDDPRMHGDRRSAIRADLDDDGWLLRYRTDDGFGTPDVAFVICHVLAGRGAGPARARRRGARAPWNASAASVAARAAVRGLRCRDGANVGQLPAGLFPRRPDPRRVRGVTALGRVRFE